ncbi:MAG: peroxisome assembly protein (Peroxin-2) [Peltula sp. TS41687]|nr:MAG: peroxisome assembly protein (Peroxin-2) [Peltula sp. TS41687]
MTNTEFALAQQRIEARRRLRAAQTQARQAPQTQSAISCGLHRLPFPISRIGRLGSETWSLVKGREGTRPTYRVGQLDAEQLDEELLSLLKDQVGEALRYFDPHFRDDWTAEINLILRTILFKLTLWDHDTTYGAALQNLRYADARKTSSVWVGPSRWQKALLGFFSVGGRYAWTKWEDWLMDQQGGLDEPSDNVRLLSRTASLISLMHSTAALASFLVFLTNGRYRTLLDRILRLRLTPRTDQLHRELSFEYLNRQLVWHAFTEFLLFLLPLVGIRRWRRWLSKAFQRIRSLVRGTSSQGEQENETRGALSFLPERTCAICYRDQNPTYTSEQDILAATGSAGGVIGSAQTDITNPYETIPCGCVYCFVCLAQTLEAEDGHAWVCLRCGALVQECKPWTGDVLEVADDSERVTDPKFHSKQSEDVILEQITG